jgi:hypothetical protein
VLPIRGNSKLFRLREGGGDRFGGERFLLALGAGEQDAGRHAGARSRHGRERFEYGAAEQTLRRDDLSAVVGKASKTAQYGPTT